jgi:hypothetical protein
LIVDEAFGCWILALLAAVVAVAVIGQALARQSNVESENYPTFSALGADRRQLFAFGTARNLAIGLAGALGALGVAYVLSSVAPLGEARIAEASGDLIFDWVALPLGALATTLAVVLLGSLPAAHASRARLARDRMMTARPTSLAPRLGRVGASPSAVIGVQSALDRRSSGSTVPIGSALLGTIVAVSALCGTAVFGSSLSHLTSTPILYGDAFSLNFSNPNGGPPDQSFVRQLEQDREIPGVMEGYALEIRVGTINVGTERFVR